MPRSFFGCLFLFNEFFALWVSYLFALTIFWLQCLKLDTLWSRVEKTHPKILVLKLFNYDYFDAQVIFWCLFLLNEFFSLWVSYLFVLTLFWLECLKLDTLRSRIEKGQSKNSCPKIDQLWLFWCLVFFGCLFLLNEFFALWVTYLLVYDFFGYSVKNLIHSDPETKKPIWKFWASKLINYDQL